MAKVQTVTRIQEKVMRLRFKTASVICSFKAPWS